VNVVAINAAYEQQVLDLVNSYRAANNPSLPPLKRNTDLDYASRFHTKDMIDDNYFQHDSYDRQGGNLVEVCSWDTRVSHFFSGWSNLGENIAAGYSTPDAVMTGWMNSSGHRANILGGYREIGIGYYNGGGSYGSYWAQDFGTRSSVYPIVINRDAAQTSTPQVSLYIYGQGTWNEMRLRNDSDAWTAWQPFQANLNWTLNCIMGTRTVSVELRKTGGATGASSSDTINLTGTSASLGNVPASLTFVYDQAGARMYPAQINVQPLNTTCSTSITWQDTAADTWLYRSITGGSTPNSILSIYPQGTVLQSLGPHDTSLTITATNPPGVNPSSQTAQIHLLVVPALPYTIHLPMILK
jgi:hypothetical protein